MKILHLLKTTDGAAWAVKLLRELVGHGVEVHVALPNLEGKASQYSDNGCHVHCLDIDVGIKKAFSNFALVKGLRKLILDVKPDIVHSHFVSTTLAMRLAMRGMDTPRIFQVPGPLHLEHALFRMIDYYSSNSCDKWIATCEWTKKKYLSMGVAPGNVGLSYYGTDTESFKPLSSSKLDLRRELGLRNDTKLIAIVAYMYPPKKYLGQTRGLKGHEDLIDAVAIAEKSYDNLQLICIGGTWGGGEGYTQAVEAYGQKLLGSKVSFLGNRNDVIDLYTQLDIAVFPSHSENVGGAVESLLMNVPTITSSVGGFPDLVRHEVTGLLVAPKDPSSLATAILRYLNDESFSRELGKRGHDLAKKMFDVSSTSQEVTQFYRQILS